MWHLTTDYLDFFDITCVVSMFLSMLHPYVYFGFVSMACHHSYISLILVFVSLSAACLLYICCIVRLWALSSFNKTLKLTDTTITSRELSTKYF